MCITKGRKSLFSRHVKLWDLTVFALFIFRNECYLPVLFPKIKIYVIDPDWIFFGHIFLGDLEVGGEVIIKTQTVTVSKDQILPQTMAGGPAMEAQETGR